MIHVIKRKIRMIDRSGSRGLAAAYRGPSVPVPGAVAPTGD